MSIKARNLLILRKHYEKHGSFATLDAMRSVAAAILAGH